MGVEGAGSFVLMSEIHPILIVPSDALCYGQQLECQSTERGHVHYYYVPMTFWMCWV